MRLITRISLLSLLSLSLSLVACGGGEDESGGTEITQCDLSTATDHTFVVSEVKVPRNPNEATRTYALDIDQAEDGRAENVLGSLIGSLADTAGFDVTGAVDAAVNAGDVVLLTNVKAENLTQGCASVGVYLGDTQAITPSPCIDENDMVCGQHLTGEGTFELDPASPLDTSVIGTIAGTQFALKRDDPPGNFEIQINLLEGDPITLKLIGARVEIGAVSEDGLMEGLIGGAITAEDLDNSILPTVQMLAQDAYTGGTEPDCALNGDVCECTPETPGALLQAFDENTDCMITVEELKADPIISTFLSPDLDLLDEAGNYNPNVDQDDDALSIGLGFTAVRGTFTAP